MNSILNTWAYIFIGALVAYLVQIAIPFAGRTALYLWNRFFEKNPLLGEWHGYHYSYKSNEPILVSDKITIKRGIRNSLSVYMKEGVEPNLEYLGNVSKERNFLLFNLFSLAHRETLTARFPDPLGNKCDKLYGIWSSFDHDQNIASGGILLSRKQLKHEEVLKEFTHFIKPDSVLPLLRLKL